MMKRLALASFALCMTATIALAQPPAPGKYDRAVEASYGASSQCGQRRRARWHRRRASQSQDRDRHHVRVHLGPAVFIGMNNFSFLADDLVLVRGAYVSHDGDVAVWARQVSKEGKTLALRDENGAPRWTQATADDPDGCGVSHAPVRY
jgi:hypothetical protein